MKLKGKRTERYSDLGIESDVSQARSILMH